jgi:hypothetical protein
VIDGRPIGGLQELQDAAEDGSLARLAP